MKLLLKSISCVVLLTICESLVASPALQLGWIEVIEAKPNQYYIDRAGKHIKVSVLSPLYRGDKIIVQANDASLSFMANDQSITVNRSNSPYTISSQAEPSPLSRLVAKVSLLLGAEDGSYTVGAVSRGKALNIHSLDTPNVKVLARDAYYLRWNNGRAPYTIEITDEATETLLASEVNISAMESYVDIKEPLPETLLVSIESDIQKKLYSLKVITKQELPAAPTELIENRSQSTPAMYAYWLYTKEDGVWAFEAIQQLKLLADNNDPLAKALLGKLR